MFVDRHKPASPILVISTLVGAARLAECSEGETYWSTETWSTNPSEEDMWVQSIAIVRDRRERVLWVRRPCLERQTKVAELYEISIDPSTNLQAHECLPLALDRPGNGCLLVAQGTRSRALNRDG